MLLLLPKIVILTGFGLLFLVCIWAYLKDKREGSGSVKVKDGIFFLVRVVVFGGGALFLLLIIYMVIYYAGGGH